MKYYVYYKTGMTVITGNKRNTLGAVDSEGPFDESEVVAARRRMQARHDEERLQASSEWRLAHGWTQMEVEGEKVWKSPEACRYEANGGTLRIAHYLRGGFELVPT